MTNLKFHLLAMGFITVTVLTACAENPPQNKPVAVPLTPATSIVATPRLRTLASQVAYRYGVDRRLFHALITQESAWNPNAVSSKGAMGLTQIMPLTGRTECGLNTEVLRDPEYNLHCGAYYLSKLLRRFNDVELALAAYNSGETRVARLGHVPRIRETERYVKQILRNWRGW
jgi:soluble lytic murein transglycosylase-like protein